jgi:hypothetical protein
MENYVKGVHMPVSEQLSENRFDDDALIVRVRSVCNEVLESRSKIDASMAKLDIATNRMIEEIEYNRKLKEKTEAAVNKFLEKINSLINKLMEVLEKLFLRKQKTK